MKLDRYIIVFLLIAAVVVLSFFIPPIYAMALIPAVAVGAILLGHPRTLLFIHLWFMGVYPLLNEAFPSLLMKHADEVLDVALYAVFFGHLAFRRIEFRHAKRFGTLALAMFGYAVLTWLVNRGYPRAAVQTFFTYFSFIPFYMLALKYFKKSDFKLLLTGTLLFLGLNVFLNAGWRLGFNPLYNEFVRYSGRWNVDVERGTLAGCNMVAYFCSMLLFLLISVWMNQPKQKQPWVRKPILLISAVVLLIQLHGTYTNHAYMFLGLALFPYLFITGLWKKVQIVVLGGIAVVAIIAALTFSEQIQAQFSAENLRDRYERFSYGAKYQLFEALLVQHRKGNPAQWMFGVGPGNGMGAIGADNYTPMAIKFLLPFYMRDAGRMRSETDMTSITGSTTSAVLTLWGDFGLFGFVLFCSFYVILFRQAWRSASDQGASLRDKTIAQFLAGALPFFFIVNIFIDVLVYEFFVLWIWAWAALLALPEEASRELPTETVYLEESHV